MRKERPVQRAASEKSAEICGCITPSRWRSVRSRLPEAQRVCSRLKSILWVFGVCFLMVSFGPLVRGDEAPKPGALLRYDDTSWRNHSQDSNHFSPGTKLTVSLFHAKDDSATADNQSSQRNGSVPAPSWEQPTDTPPVFLSLAGIRMRPVPGAVGLGNLRLGYGYRFADDAVIGHHRNGTNWEEHGCFYLKVCLRF